MLAWPCALEHYLRNKTEPTLDPLPRDPAKPGPSLVVAVARLPYFVRGWPM
jgi:hypothetical protein